MSVSATKNRQEAWRERFREFAEKPPEQMGDNWGVLLKELDLTNDYYLAVCEVLMQGRWAEAQYPRAYVKSAATAEARKMHLSIPHKDDTLECGEPALVFMGGGELDRGTTRKGIEAALDSEDREHSAARPKRLKGKHRVSAQFDPDDEVLERERLALENGPFWPRDCWVEPQLPALLIRRMKAFHEKHPDQYLVVQAPLVRRDWQKLGEKAGLDPWEIRVVEYRSQGASLKRAMELQPDEVSRKAIQAAWKRFDRRGKKKKSGMQRVQLFLGKNVPEELSGDTRDIEGCTPPPPKAALPGNPLQEPWRRSGGTSREDLGKFLIKYRGRAPHLWGSLVRILDSKCPG